MYGIYYMMGWTIRYWTIRYWTGRPDRSPLHSCGGRLLNYVLTKCQTKGSTMSFLTPKYDLVDSEGLLERFAKYRLMQTGALERHSGGCWEGMGVLFLLPVPNSSLFITIWFVDSILLLESETHFFLLSFSKDLTSGRETIVFGRWNYIVWGGKLYCLARETILFRARFVCFSKMKCIVF